jgi:hypothetical protein
MDKLRSDRVRELCSRIQTEQDQEKFLELVQELNQVLGGEDGGSESDSPNRDK